MPLPFTNFVKTTTIVGAPTDTLVGVAPGRDPLGLALTTADYDDLGHADGSFNITESTGTPFASVQVGDYIHLAGGTGITVGLYEIATVTSDNSINLTESAGSDSTGDVTSSIGPWATIQYGLDNTVATGDQLVICNDGNGSGGGGTHWEYTATLAIDTNQGGPQGISLRGASSRGLVDGTQIVISGAAPIAASTPLVTISGGIDSWLFYDIRFTGAVSDHNVDCGSNGQIEHLFFRCRFDGAIGANSDGINFEGSGFEFTDCELDGNGRYGAGNTVANRGNDTLFRRCRVHDNVSHGVLLGGTGAGAIQSHFYGNGGDGWSINRQPSNMWWDGCVFFNNGGDGIGMTSSPFGTMLKSLSNSVFRSNGAFAISLGTSSTSIPQIDHCCFHDNTSGTLDTGGAGVAAFLGEGPGLDSNIYVDPEFTSETDGSEDFTPATGSPLIDAGIQVAVN